MLHGTSYRGHQMRAKVVIGAGLGDEGKGLMVDYLAHKNPKSTVVRFNGGCQALHTVQINGERTGFQHYGSGTAVGVPTFLGKEFIVNPVLFHKERKALNKGSVQCHVESRVTTPYDMMHNTLLETSRGGNRHGSCGLGINATVNRHIAVPFNACHLPHPAKVKEILRQTYKYYKELHKGTELAGLNALQTLRDTVEDPFVHNCIQFINKVDLENEGYLKYNNCVIFEGAQGLLLDENHEWFPHVTRSKTGLTNVIDILKQLPYANKVEVTYMTRAYLTRHGAGPLPNEDTDMHFEDKTNLPNTWQGKLRYAPLDIDLLLETIKYDLMGIALRSDIRVSVEPKLCITCLDQMEHVDFVYNKNRMSLTVPNFITFMSTLWGGGLLVSYGPERTDIKTIR